MPSAALRAIRSSSRRITSSRSIRHDENTLARLTPSRQERSALPTLAALAATYCHKKPPGDINATGTCRAARRAGHGVANSRTSHEGAGRQIAISHHGADRAIPDGARCGNRARPHGGSRVDLERRADLSVGPEEL